MKNPTKMLLALAIIGLGIGGTPTVFADGRHGSVRMGAHWRTPVHRHHGAARWGLFPGVPLVLSSAYWGPRHFYREPYYSPYYTQVVTVPAMPPTYIEQGPAVPAEPTAATPPLKPGYWYFCKDSQTYYPYVSECPGGWQRVSPQPPH